MKFFKKNDTVESLTKKCREQHSDFLSHITKGHYKNYVEFKFQLKDDFAYLSDTLAKAQNEYVVMALLQHLKEQLKFINENPFSADKDKLDAFIEKNYPYKEKITNIINNILEQDIETNPLKKLKP